MTIQEVDMKPFVLVFSVLVACVSVAVAASEPSARGLDEWVRLSLDQNPSVRAMTHRVAAADAVRRQARSAWMPRFDAGAAYTITDNAPQAFMMKLNQRQLDMSLPGFDFNNPDDTDNISLSLGVRYRLYDGARSARILGADLGAQMMAARHDVMRNALVHAVTRGYYEVLQAQAFVTVQNAALDSLEESLRVASERFDSGSVVKTDVLNLEVKTAQARENLIRAQNGVQLAIAALNTAIGTNVIDASGLAIPPLNPQPPSEFAYPADSERPEMRASMFAVQAERAALQAARKQQLPVVNGFGSLNWDGEDISGQEQSYTAGVALEWEWFSGFEQRARVDAARQLVGAAEAQSERVQQELAFDRRQATLAVEEAWQRFQVTSHAVSSAEEALRITRAQYKEGAAEISVLLVAELGLTETRMRNTSAIYDYQIARSNLERALGLLGSRYQ
jgi:outer membrane protein